jgi:hypothetical protein
VTNSGEPVHVSKAVHDGIKAVEKIGVDLHNPAQVKDMATKTGHHATARWINKNMPEYMRGALEDGFKSSK